MAAKGNCGWLPARRGPPGEGINQKRQVQSVEWGRGVADPLIVCSPPCRALGQICSNRELAAPRVQTEGGWARGGGLRAEGPRFLFAALMSAL